MAQTQHMLDFQTNKYTRLQQTESQWFYVSPMIKLCRHKSTIDSAIHNLDQWYEHLKANHVYALVFVKTHFRGLLTYCTFAKSISSFHVAVIFIGQ